MKKIDIKLVKNIFVSVSSAVIDITLFKIIEIILGKGNVLATYIARVISGGYNFTLSKIWTFDQKNSKNTRKESIKYLILFLVQMQVSAWSTNLFEKVFPSIDSLFIKIGVDVVIFFINFLMLDHWVFKNKKKDL